MRTLVVLMSAAALAACSSPPKPPTVSGNDRSTVNSAETIEALGLRTDLARARDRVRELESRPIPTAVLAPVPLPRPKSETITFYYPFNKADFRPTLAQETALASLLASARRVEIRGRTDGPRPSPADERIAFLRAQGAMNYVVSRGMPATRVTVNYVSGSDYIGINDTTLGRMQNRRVEIEVFNQ